MQRHLLRVGASAQDAAHLVRTCLDTPRILRPSWSGGKIISECSLCALVAVQQRRPAAGCIAACCIAPERILQLTLVDTPHSRPYATVRHAAAPCCSGVTPRNTEPSQGAGPRRMRDQACTPRNPLGSRKISRWVPIWYRTVNVPQQGPHGWFSVGWHASPLLGMHWCTRAAGQASRWAARRTLANGWQVTVRAAHQQRPASPRQPGCLR